MTLAGAAGSSVGDSAASKKPKLLVLLTIGAFLFLSAAMKSASSRESPFALLETASSRRSVFLSFFCFFSFFFSFFSFFFFSFFFFSFFSFRRFSDLCSREVSWVAAFSRYKAPVITVASTQTTVTLIRSVTPVSLSHLASSLCTNHIQFKG